MLSRALTTATMCGPLLSITHSARSPIAASVIDPQPYIEAGYYTEHHKIMAGAIHADYKNEAILGYAYDFNERWRVQVDWQSGKENSSTLGFTCNVTPDFQFNPALYVNNGPKHDLFGYIVFTYTFHLWHGKKDVMPVATRETGVK